MADHEASTTVDVAPNILFDYLADVERLPEYLPWLTGVYPTGPRPAEAQGMEARRPQQPVHQKVEVTAVDPAAEPSEQPVHSEAWIDVVEENRSLRWGAPGDNGYHGELDVDFVADGTSRLTVRLHTTQAPDQEIDHHLHHALETIKSTIENTPPTPGDTPQA
ncbi:SRPBCC family protein [Kribbella turkmenica]|uniref:SRPBCC family protein n=1 Tax=Kribbella turkmenica TaxID=2530375 RepID=A0A4R4WWN0_9ACTN|nr:SRPBCC family protein [Kribbella turkmenica]TDD22179.1 SRPBCC family protein [Kribbella turkmenica]